MTHKTLFRTLPLLLGALALTACACPRTPEYTGTPYSHNDLGERTAGSGPSKEEESMCIERAMIPDWL